LHNSDCKLINLSSAAVYGNPESIPTNESSALKPLSNYGYHKKYAEEICNQYWNIYQIRSTSLRIFSAYGIGLKKQIFWDIFKKTENISTITLFGTVNETRDYIFIDDLVKAIELIIEKGDFNASVYNVSSGEQTHIQQAAEILLKSLNWKGKLIFNNENRIGDPLNWHADITKLKKLGFSPAFSINKGLEKVSEWMKNITE
jgi:dTDP-glucose 4,6-dehydratase/UDP-glucose 4-epimerase